MLEVKSGVLIEKGMKSHGPEPRARAQKLCFDLEGYEKVTVRSPVFEVKSYVLIERGMKKSRSGAPCSRSKVVF